ncbi:MAG: hypothetical protein AMXMBFR33_57890 [Candidatus Xenobia bacterium]
MSEKLTLLDRLVAAMHKRSAENTDRQAQLDERERRSAEAFSQAGQVVDAINRGVLAQLRAELRPLNLGVQVAMLDHSGAGYGPRIEAWLGDDRALFAYCAEADRWERMGRIRDVSGQPCWGNFEPFCGRADFAEKVQAAVEAMLEAGALVEWVKRGRCLA